MNIATGSIVRAYRSARDPGRGRNLALLTCAAFTSRAPTERQTWRIQLDAIGVRAICDFPEQRFEFDRSAFARDPRIAGVEWNRA